MSPIADAVLCHSLLLKIALCDSFLAGASDTFIVDKGMFWKLIPTQTPQLQLHPHCLWGNGQHQTLIRKQGWDGGQPHSEQQPTLVFTIHPKQKQGE